MKEEKKGDKQVYRMLVVSMYIQMLLTAEHKFCRSLTSVSNQDTELTCLLPSLFSLILHILAFAILLTLSRF